MDEYMEQNRKAYDIFMTNTTKIDCIIYMKFNDFLWKKYQLPENVVLSYFISVLPIVWF